jgi:hypothetical protein
VRLRFRSVEVGGSISVVLDGDEGCSGFETCWNAPGRVGLSTMGMMDVSSNAKIEGRVGLSIKGNFSPSELESDEGLQVNIDIPERQYISSDSFRLSVTSLTINIDKENGYPFFTLPCAWALDPSLQAPFTRSLDLYLPNLSSPPFLS